MIISSALHPKSDGTVFASLSELDIQERNDVKTNPTPIENTVVTPSGHTLYYVITDAVNKYVSLDHVVIEEDMEVANPLVGDLVIPETVIISGETYTVTGLRAMAFAEKSELLTSVTLPSTIHRIPYACFMNSSDYVSGCIYNLDYITSIGASALGGNLMNEIYLPSTIVEIGDNVFGESYIETIYVVEGSYAETWIDANGLSSKKQYYTPTPQPSTGVVTDVLIPVVAVSVVAVMVAVVIIDSKRNGKFKKNV